MGYTHYWRKPESAPEDWARFVAAVRRVFGKDKARGKLAGWDGDGVPSITDDEVAFNGAAPQDYESFRIERGPMRYEFCKTGRRPYDGYAVAVLLLAAHYLPGFTWASDGDPDDHEAGYRLACEGVPLSEWPAFGKARREKLVKTLG